MNKQEVRDLVAAAGATDLFGREVRMSKSPVTVTRAEGDDDPQLQGYAAIFNRETNIGGWFREIIAPGAFTKTIDEADVRHLFNHDPSQIIGRNKSGTLRLDEDDTGLSYDVDLNMNDSDAVRVFEKVSRGDVDQSSFAFTIIKEMWEEPDEPGSGELPLRTVLEAKLFDTSTVTYPAYEDTTALIASSVSEGALRELTGLNVGIEDVARALHTRSLTPGLAPILREIEHHVSDLAAECEGDSCSGETANDPDGTTKIQVVFGNREEDISAEDLGSPVTDDSSQPAAEEAPGDDEGAAEEAPTEEIVEETVEEEQEPEELFEFNSSSALIKFHEGETQRLRALVDLYK